MVCLYTWKAKRRHSLKVFKVFAFFSLTMLTFLVRPASAKVSHDFASWTGILFQGGFTTKYGYYLEIQDRLNKTLAGGNRFIIRPAFRYSVTTELSLWAGYGWLPAFSPFRGENRLWQQAFYQTRAGSWQLIGRVRIDERWLSNAGGAAFRGRVMFRSLLALDPEALISLCFWDEYFQNLNTVSNGPVSGFDQNRSFLGLNYLLTKDIQVESGYLNVFVNQSGTAPDIMNHILGLYIILNV